MSQRNHVGKSVILILLGIGVVSCDSSSNSGGSGGSMGEMAAALDAKRAAEQKEQARLDAERKAEEARRAATAAAQSPAERPRKKAGRAPVGEGGYLTAIVGARRHILNEAESWSWKTGVRSFKATEGRKPKDHKEFMERIVIPLGIELGYIEEGQEFYYDPNGESDGDFGQLYVVEKVDAPIQEEAPVE